MAAEPFPGEPPNGGLYEHGDQPSVTVTLDDLRRWAAAATLADSYMSLVYHRRAIREWGSVATPQEQEWVSAMNKARRASEHMASVLAKHGVDWHAIAREMDR